MNIIIKGHEIDKKDFAEIMRTHASITLSPHVRKEDKPKIEPKRLWPLPWDRKPKTNKASLSKVKKLAQIYRSGKIKPKENGKS